MSDSGREQEAGKRSAPPHEEGASAAAAFCPNPASQAQAGHMANATEGVDSPQEAAETTRRRGSGRSRGRARGQGQSRGRGQVRGQDGRGGDGGARGGSSRGESSRGGSSRGGSPRGDSPRRGTRGGTTWRGRSSRGGNPWEATSWRERPWEASSWRGGSQGDAARGGSAGGRGDSRVRSTLSATAAPFTPMSQRVSEDNPPPHAQGLAALPEHDSEPATALQQPTQPSRNNGGGAPASQAGPSAMSHAPTTRDAPRRALLPLTQEERIQQERERHERAVGFDSSDDEEFIPLIRDL